MTFTDLLRIAAKAIAEELVDKNIVRDEIVQEGERFYLRCDNLMFLPKK